MFPYRTLIVNGTGVTLNAPFCIPDGCIDDKGAQQYMDETDAQFKIWAKYNYGEGCDPKVKFLVYVLIMFQLFYLD